MGSPGLPVWVWPWPKSSSLIPNHVAHSFGCLLNAVASWLDFENQSDWQSGAARPTKEVCSVFTFFVNERSCLLTGKPPRAIHFTWGCQESRRDNKYYDSFQAYCIVNTCDCMFFLKVYTRVYISTYSLWQTMLYFLGRGIDWGGGTTSNRRWKFLSCGQQGACGTGRTIAPKLSTEP